MLSRNRWTAMRLILAPKTTGQTKKPYFNPSTILGPKWPICPEQTFFSTNHHYFDLPIRPFFSAKFLKKFLLIAGPELWGCAIFGPKLSICSKQKLFWKNYQYHFHLTHGPFHCAKYCRSRIMMCHFWAQNDPFSQMRFFSENLLMSLVPFIHVSLHTKNQSQILIY